MPDLQLDDGTRLSDHAHRGRALLVDLAEDDHLAAQAKRYAGRLELIRGRSTDSDGTDGPEGTDGTFGAGSARLGGLLVRPDGFVAWAADDGVGDPAGLEKALARWLGRDGQPGRAIRCG